MLTVSWVIPTSANTVYADPSAAVTEAVRYGMEIEFDMASKGVVSVFYNSEEDMKMKVVVQCGADRYIYNLYNRNEYVNYPLQMGDGLYTVSIYQNTTGNKYRKLDSKSANVTIGNKNDVFLQSTLEVNWDEEDASIILADELVEAALLAKQEKALEQDREQVRLTDTEIISVIYEYVIDNIVYDYDKIKGLDYSYIPVNDITLEIGSGICYDYSALLASMLRSQGIPAKMAKGYLNESGVYHAWNEIYIGGEDRWVVVDSTLDAYRKQNGYTYVLEKDGGTYNKVKEL